MLVAVPRGSRSDGCLGALPHEVPPLQVGLHDHVHAPLGVGEVQRLVTATTAAVVAVLLVSVSEVVTVVIVVAVVMVVIVVVVMVVMMVA